MFEYPVTTFKADCIIISISVGDLEMVFPKNSFQNTSYFPY